MRPLLWALTALTAGGGLLGASACRPPALGDPVRGLTATQKQDFKRGRAVFTRVFTPETGLGPLFNADSCGECHEERTVGGVGDETEIHATALQADGFCDPLAGEGGPVFQQQVTPALKAALGIDSEPVPPSTTARGTRTTPDVFGFGLLDLVPDAEILALADPDDRNGDGISGRPNRFFDGRIGRFGRKALVPSLAEFNEGALVAEQGVTTQRIPDEGTIGGQAIPPGVDPLPEPEIDARGVADLNAFVRFLAPPAPARAGNRARRGQSLFTRIGCAKCHVTSLTTGKSKVAALSHRTVAAYTDLLLHDMGPELADICLGLASPSEFRTEPLMGLRLSTRFLHDGRAASIEDAIALHGGEGAGARARFVALDPADRKAMLAFLESL